MAMKMLVVGAGALGQVYCRHAQLGGAEVSVLVKSKYAQLARAGFAMYPLNRPRARRTEALQLERLQVLTEISEAAAQRWDFVVLAVSSTALRAGTWLAELAAASGDAAWVVMQPGEEDFDLVGGLVGAERIVAGLLGVASYATPRTDAEEWPEPGTAYWLPPMASFPLVGPEETTRPLAELLRRGGLPAKFEPNARASIAYGSAVINTLMAALECAGWDFARLRSHEDLLDLACRSSRQGMALARAAHGRGPFGLGLVRPSVVRMILRVGPSFAPFDLEAFFRVHFTKVGDQTRLLLENTAARLGELGLPNDAVVELRARLDANS